MKKFKGIPASPGIAIHHAFAHYTDTDIVPRYLIKEANIASEWKRFQSAADLAATDIRSIKEKLDPATTEQRHLLDAQLLMLLDPEMNEHIQNKLQETQYNVESILSDYVESIVSILESSGDEYLAERAVDILDVSRRITDQLLYRERLSLSHIESDIILVTHNLHPSETIQLNPDKVRGIALDVGGRMSHTAIFARALGIPAVFGLQDICQNIQPNELVIVDGDKGFVIVNPDEKILLQYRDELGKLEKRESKFMDIQELATETSDGRVVSLMANIEIPEEIDLIHSSNAEGIGLFRTEFLFMSNQEQPDEERQYRAYVHVLDAMGDKPVTIRTLDIGGDKLLPSMNGTNELNPLLGCRAIRFCLRNEELFRTQLRALLRASVYGNLRIMYPLISNIQEVNLANKLLSQERRKLETAGTPMATAIPVGVMIEVPSAAFISDILARHVDFFSIGTNDLIQYTLAVDRGNDKIADLYQPWHPALWRLIKLTVNNAKAAGIPVALCGEIAGDPIAAILLIALGLEELSMNAFRIPEVKHFIRSITMKEAEETLGKVMEAESSDVVECLLMKKFGSYLDL